MNTPSPLDSLARYSLASAMNAIVPTDDNRLDLSRRLEEARTDVEQLQFVIHSLITSTVKCLDDRVMPLAGYALTGLAELTKALEIGLAAFEGAATH